MTFIKRFLFTANDFVVFAATVLKEMFTRPFEFREVIRQCYEIGWKSFPLIGFTGFVVGVVFTMQSRPTLAEFGAASLVPTMISIAIVRALAPLVTALIAAGKVGSQIGAEISSMRVTEQIDAMDVSGNNPIKYLVVTRVIATTIMIPTLCVFVAAISLAGGYFSIADKDQISLTAYLVRVFQTLNLGDLGAMLLRAVFFGFTIGLASTYIGYYATDGTKGVGVAANEAVVYSMFTIFIEEIIIVQFLPMF